MMTIKMFRLLQIFSYVLVLSQLLFYFFLFSDAMKLISIENFLELRKVVDTQFALRLKSMYYSCLLLTALSLIISARVYTSTFFISSCIAMVCIIADTWIALKGNVPINQQFNHYELKNSVDWQALRIQWLTLINCRAIIVAIGFIALLGGLVIEKTISEK